MLTKCCEYNINVYLVFTDFWQSYYSVRREKIQKAVQKRYKRQYRKDTKAVQHSQIPYKLIRLVKATMDNMVAKVEVQTKMTELFGIRDGLKQGDGLAPLLFNLVMEHVERTVTADRNTKLQYTLIQIVGSADVTVYA